MRDSQEDAELARRFRESATTSHPRAPLYAALSAGIARDHELFGLLHHAPAQQRLPVLLFATTHALLLADPLHPLAAWYPNLTETPRSPTEPALIATFKQFVQENEPELRHLLATRSVQTNEVGRCLMLLPALALVGHEVGALAHLDVGTSGGLNLLLDKFSYEYAPFDGAPASTIGAPAEVHLVASTKGAGAVPATMPTVTTRCGIDTLPIDITNDDEARWLEACVWPDQRDRFLRLRAAIELARQHPPEILAGDAVDSLHPAVSRLARSGHPIVTNSWVMNYLDDNQRLAYVAELDRIGSTTDLSWVYVEAPALTPGLPWDIDPADPYLTVLALARWRGGVRTVDYLATTHPHGFWIHWM